MELGFDHVTHGSFQPSVTSFRHALFQIDPNLLLIRGVGGVGLSGVFGKDFTVLGDFNGVLEGDVFDGNLDTGFFGDAATPFVVGRFS